MLEKATASKPKNEKLLSLIVDAKPRENLYKIVMEIPTYQNSAPQRSRVM